MLRLLLEARDKDSEFGRLYKIYGKRVVNSVNQSYIQRYGERDGVRVVFDSCLESLGYDISSYYPPCAEYVMRMIIGGDFEFDEHTRNLFDYFEECKSKGILKKLGLSNNILDYSVEDLSSLEDEFCRHKEYNPMYQKISKFGDAIECLYENGESGVFMVNTWRANRLLGAGTSWCTVANLMHNAGYGGVYYIICHLDKAGQPILDGDRIQFHLDYYDGLYMMDVEDLGVDKSDISERFGEDVTHFVSDMEDSEHERRKDYGGGFSQRNQKELYQKVNEVMFEGKELNEVLGMIGEFVGSDVRIDEISYDAANMKIVLFLCNGMILNLYPYQEFGEDGERWTLCKNEDEYANAHLGGSLYNDVVNVALMFDGYDKSVDRQLGLINLAMRISFDKDLSWFGLDGICDGLKSCRVSEKDLYSDILRHTYFGWGAFGVEFKITEGLLKGCNFVFEKRISDGLEMVGNMRSSALSADFKLFVKRVGVFVELLDFVLGKDEDFTDIRCYNHTESFTVWLSRDCALSLKIDGHLGIKGRYGSSIEHLIDEPFGELVDRVFYYFYQ